MKIQHLILTATTALMASNAFSATTYTYDANGRVIEKIDGSSKYTYTYDGNNQTSRTSYSCSNGSCTPSLKYEYTYDGNNMTSETIYSDASSVVNGTPTSKSEYTYDGDNMTSETSYWGASSVANGTPTSKSEYTYDGNNQTSRTSYSCSNGSCTPSLKYEYTYDGNNMTSQTMYSCSVGSCTPYNKHEYAYDGNNQTSLTYYSCSNGSCTTPNWKYEYTYDEHGNQTSAAYYYSTESIENDEPDKYGHYTNTYDDQGRLIASSSLDYDPDGNEIYKYNETWAYDKHGNLLSNTETAYYNEDGEWYLDESYDIAWEYDKYGNLLNEKNRGMDWGCLDTDCNEEGYVWGDWDDANTSTHIYDPEFIKKQWLEHRKLIYTLEEAQARVKEIGKDHVTFRIRYK